MISILNIIDISISTLLKFFQMGLFRNELYDTLLKALCGALALACVYLLCKTVCVWISRHKFTLAGAGMLSAGVYWMVNYSTY